MFRLDHGVLTAKIWRPTDNELKRLDVIELTSDIPWDPSELDEDEVLNEDAIVIAKANPTGTEPAPCNLEEMRPYLGWKSTDIIEKTLKATTQYAKNHLRLPMRQHFKTRFPALLCRRLRETFATDTFFSSESAHDGTWMAQIFVGKTSLLTEIVGMQQESLFPEALKAFIVKWGAPDALLSDNAQVEISAAVQAILRAYNIRQETTEPHHPNQNPAERRIQVCKNMTNIILDRT